MTAIKTGSRILILDFGSQYTQLIARRLRELKVYCEIYPCDAPLARIREFEPKGIVLSGGPYSVYDKGAPGLSAAGKADGKTASGDLFGLAVPVLGICYGMQYLARRFGGTVVSARAREYGRAFIRRPADAKSALLPAEFMGGAANQKASQKIEKLQTWMSHGDEIGKIPKGFRLTAISHNGSPAAMEDSARGLYAVQFHPEVAHTEKGIEIFENFAYRICGLKPDWDMHSFLEEQVRLVREKVGAARAICAISGGVDSTVAATLVNRAIGSRLTCIFVNNGLLRKDEAVEVVRAYKKHLKLNVKLVDAEKRFLSALKGVTDPEKKRKIIGREFIRVFEAEARKVRGARFLVQGTLYPDVIESVPPPREVSGASGSAGFSSTIKSHHNVGGLPADMKFALIEPLRELFKDEVRALGRELSVPPGILRRHPFPGPGLAVRVMGEVTRERLDILREADSIFTEEIHRAGLYDEIWQAFVAYLPIRSVGVMGDGRTFDHVVALRAVTSQDGMTADWYPFEPEFLAHVSNRITGNVRGVNRVVYDVSSKPPSTIEWE